MHKQHEDQPSNNLPDLSTWHRVPIGAKIPAGTPYAYVNQNCVTLRLDGAYVDIDVMREGTCDVTVCDGHDPYYTEHPIVPPLPTEEGATIMVSDNELSPRFLLTRKGDRWITRYGDKFAVDQIRAWAPVEIGEVVVMP